MLNMKTSYVSDVLLLKLKYVSHDQSMQGNQNSETQVVPE